MGFNASDAQHINLAKLEGLEIHRFDAKLNGHSVMRIVLGASAANVTSATLSNAIMSASRSMNEGFSTTVWLDIQLDSLPKVVADAINDCKSFGVGLVVSFEDKCSHSPGPQLSQQLISSVRDASRGGDVWHPFSKTLVSSLA